MPDPRDWGLGAVLGLVAAAAQARAGLGREMASLASDAAISPCLLAIQASGVTLAELGAWVLWGCRKGPAKVPSGIRVAISAMPPPMRRAAQGYGEAVLSLASAISETAESAVPGGLSLVVCIYLTQHVLSRHDAVQTLEKAWRDAQDEVLLAELLVSHPTSRLPDLLSRQSARGSVPAELRHFGVLKFAIFEFLSRNQTTGKLTTTVSHAVSLLRRALRPVAGDPNATLDVLRTWKVGNWESLVRPTHREGATVIERKRTPGRRKRHRPVQRGVIPQAMSENLQEISGGAEASTSEV